MACVKMPKPKLEVVCADIRHFQEQNRKPEVSNWGRAGAGGRVGRDNNSPAGGQWGRNITTLGLGQVARFSQPWSVL